MVALRPILKEDMLMQKSNLGQILSLLQETLARLILLAWIMKNKTNQRINLQKWTHFTYKQIKRF